MTKRRSKKVKSIVDTNNIVINNFVHKNNKLSASTHVDRKKESKKGNVKNVYKYDENS